MTSRNRRVAIVAACLASAIACGRATEDAPASTPAETAPAAPQGEPLFKPIDPNAVPPPPGTPSSSMVPPLTAPAQGDEPMAMVTDMASGWPVNLRVGQFMSARLTADRQAGGRWSLRTGSAGSVLAMEGAAGYEAVPGAAGVEVFRLKATRPGQTTLTFDYKQGSSAEAAKSVSYPVVVQ